MIMNRKDLNLVALLTTLPNIGPTLAKQLQAVAITTPEQLKSTGSKVAFTADELSNQAQLFAEENFTWTFPSQDLAWTVI